MTDPNAITQPLLQQLADALKVDAGTLSADTPLADIGISSVKILRLVAALERQYGVELPDEAIFRCRTVRDLATAVAERLPADG